jgi:hypothetical protein
MADQLQNDGNIWAGLLAASGGKLEMLKCFYYILTWAWDEKGDATPQTINRQNNESSISLQQGEEEPTLLTHKDINQCHKTLGTWKCINGDEKEHIKQLEDKSTNLC